MSAKILRDQGRGARANFLKGQERAKSGVLEDGDGDPVVGAAAKVMELKRELQKIVKAIAEGDDVNLDALDKAHRLLCALKELKIKKRSLSSKIHDSSSLTVPDEFRCPLSEELMRDPVIVATGQVPTNYPPFFPLRGFLGIFSFFFPVWG